MASRLQMKPFLVSLPFSTDLNSFDPAYVQFASQYILLENLYSTLLLKSPSGGLEGNIASRFYWQDEEICFEIRDDARASDGSRITVEDARLSFQRLLMLGTATHGDLGKILCGPQQWDREDAFSRIRSDGNKLILKPADKNPSVFENFTTIDFAVIPRNAVDPKGHAIQNFAVTSGPYYIAAVDADGTIVLKTNPHHHAYSVSLPQEVHFIDTRGRNTLKLIRCGELDFLTIIDSSNVDSRVNIGTIDTDISVHMTLPMHLDMIHFTEKGLTSIPSERRWSIARKLRDSYRQLHQDSRAIEVTNQYFPPTGFGSLSSEELATIEQSFADAAADEDGSDLVIAINERHLNSVGSVLQSALPMATMVPLNKLPSFDSERKYERDFPHLYFITTDTSFVESQPNISNSVISGFLGADRNNRHEWLAAYISDPDISSRKRRLQDIHFRSLVSPQVIPLGRKPYVAVIRQPWRGEFPTLFPNTPIWRIYWAGPLPSPGSN